MLFRIIALFAMAAGVYSSATAEAPAELSAEFDKAVRYINALPKTGGVVSEPTRMLFYGDFKVATVGRCNGAPDLSGGFEGLAKYAAWTAASSKTTEEAMNDYIARLTELAPKWKEE
jgi:acyl-CoA-binding protein